MGRSDFEIGPTANLPSHIILAGEREGQTWQDTHKQQLASSSNGRRRQPPSAEVPKQPIWVGRALVRESESPLPSFLPSSNHFRKANAEKRRKKRDDRGPNLLHIGYCWGVGGFLCVASWRRVCVCVKRGFWCCLWYMTEGEAASTARVELPEAKGAGGGK